MDGVRARMQADLKSAMKARDGLRLSALRTGLGALANAEAVVVAGHSPVPVAAGTAEVARRQLTDADVRDVLRRECEELRSAAHELGRGLPVEAGELLARAALLEAYL